MFIRVSTPKQQKSLKLLNDVVAHSFVSKSQFGLFQAEYANFDSYFEEMAWSSHYPACLKHVNENLVGLLFKHKKSPNHLKFGKCYHKGFFLDSQLEPLGLFQPACFGLGNSSFSFLYWSAKYWKQGRTVNFSIWVIYRFASWLLWICFYLYLCIWLLLLLILKCQILKTR